MTRKTLRQKQIKALIEFKHNYTDLGERIKPPKPEVASKNAQINRVAKKLTEFLIQEFRERAYTYQEIGDYLGISRQRVHQISGARKLDTRKEDNGINC